MGSNSEGSLRWVMQHCLDRKDIWIRFELDQICVYTYIYIYMYSIDMIYIYIYISYIYCSYILYIYIYTVYFQFIILDFTVMDVFHYHHDVESCCRRSSTVMFKSDLLRQFKYIFGCRPIQSLMPAPPFAF